MKKIIVALVCVMLSIGYAWRSNLISMQTPAQRAWVQDPMKAQVTNLCQTHPLQFQLAITLNAGSPVYSIAYNPHNPNQLASGSDDRTIRIWDLAHPQIQPLTLTVDDRVHSVAYNPFNPNQLAAGSDELQIWNLANPQNRPLTLTGHQDGVYSIAYDPHNPNWLAVGDNEDTKIWDLAHPHIQPLTLPAYSNTVAYNPLNPNQLASAGPENGNIEIWNLTQPQIQPLTLTGHDDHVNSLAYNPHYPNQLASGSYDGSIKIWDLAHPQNQPLTLGGHGDREVLASFYYASAVHSIAYNPHNPSQLASGSRDGTIKIWDLANPQNQPLTLTGHTSGVNSLAYNPHNPRQLASGSHDGTIKIWDLSAFDWFGKGCPIAPSAPLSSGKIINADPAITMLILNGISQAITNNTKVTLTGSELAYLTKLIFPQLSQSTQNIIKNYVAVERRQPTRAADAGPSQNDLMLVDNPIPVEEPIQIEPQQPTREHKRQKMLEAAEQRLGKDKQ